MIYTVGHGVGYRESYAVRAANGLRLIKKGAGPDYPGGCAVRTREDAERLLVEFCKVGVWEVFGLEADWEADTKPCVDGWWHNLQRDAPIVLLDVVSE